SSTSSGSFVNLGNNNFADNSKGFTPATLTPTQGGSGTAHTWVSGVGNDANAASRTAPGLTFAGVLSKTATGGEISNIDPGDFGTLTITHSLTLDGTQGVAHIDTTAAVNAITINAA